MDMVGFSAFKIRSFKLDLFLCHCFLLLTICRAKSGPSSLPVCQRPTLQEVFLGQRDQSLFIDTRFLGDVCGNDGGIASRITEVNGTTLDRVLNVIQSRQDAYVAVLFYAKWCPFSQSLRAAFDALSVLFPSIYHASVEEASLRPSGLSQYGVHSFPALFLHNQTLRIRYYGPRTVEALSHFYKDVTGLQPVSNHSLKELIGVQKQRSNDITGRIDNFPYGWMMFPEKLLHDEIYLTLASLFLLLKLFYCILPKVAACIKHYWVENAHVLRAAKAVIRREPQLQSNLEQFAKKNRIVKGKGLKAEMVPVNSTIRRGPFVRSWSSSSLAPVTLAEGSSGKVGNSDECWESGR